MLQLHERFRITNFLYVFVVLLFFAGLSYFQEGKSLEGGWSCYTALTLVAGIFVYKRTKMRRFGHSVKGSPVIEYLLLSILLIHAIAGLSMLGRLTGEQSLCLTIELGSIIAFLFAKYEKLADDKG